MKYCKNANLEIKNYNYSFIDFIQLFLDHLSLDKITSYKSEPNQSIRFNNIHL